MHPLLDPDARPVIGHRGNAAHAPENTLVSFEQAIALGVDAVELDVRRSADGTVVVMHDPTVERTTNGTGRVAELTLEELRRLDAGFRFTTDGGATYPYRGRGIEIPTLEEVLVGYADTPLLIEIKSADAAEPTRKLIESHGAADRCIVDSFDARALAPFRGSAIPFGPARRGVARLILPSMAGIKRRRLPFSVMCIPPSFNGIPLPIAALVRSTTPASCPIHIWTINDAASARRLWAQGVRGIISDDPAVILRAREEG